MAAVMSAQSSAKAGALDSAKPTAPSARRYLMRRYLLFLGLDGADRRLDIVVIICGDEAVIADLDFRLERQLGGRDPDLVVAHQPGILGMDQIDRGGMVIDPIRPVEMASHVGG